MMDFFERFSHDLSPATFGEQKFMPKIDVQDTGSGYEIRAEIPGMNEKDLNVYLSDDRLVIEGEKKNEWSKNEKGFYQSEISYGSFYRSIPLRDEVESEKVEATYKDGLLSVSLKKRAESQAKNKKIKINSPASRSVENKH
jgi:HSP20 family protein